MARPYSLDLRERVVAQVSGGMSCHEAAELNNIVPSTVVKWTQRQRLTGSPAARREQLQKSAARQRAGSA